MKRIKENCKATRRRERHFLKNVINFFQQDEGNLTEASCEEMCKKNKVQGAMCKELCKTKDPPCTYWHNDIYNSPRVKREAIDKNSDEKVEAEKDDSWDMCRTEQEAVHDVQVVQLSVLTPCNHISCISPSNTSLVACFDFEDTARLRPLQSGYLPTMAKFC